MLFVAMESHRPVAVKYRAMNELWFCYGVS